MLIGQTEGNLTGLVTIHLTRSVITSNYSVVFEFKDQNGCFRKFIPQFVVTEYDNYLQFNATGYEAMYLRVMVFHHCRQPLLPGQHVIPYGGNIFDNVDEVGSMNDGWRVKR